MFTKGFPYVKPCANTIPGLSSNPHNHHVRREKKDALGPAQWHSGCLHGLPQQSGVDASDPRHRPSTACQATLWWHPT